MPSGSAQRAVRSAGQLPATLTQDTRGYPSFTGVAAPSLRWTANYDYDNSNLSYSCSGTAFLSQYIPRLGPLPGGSG